MVAIQSKNGFLLVKKINMVKLFRYLTLNVEQMHSFFVCIYALETYTADTGTSLLPKY